MTVLYGTHYRALVRLAALLAGDVAVAEEIVQAAFAAMHNAWRRLGDGDTASAYLLRAVVSRSRSHRAPRPDPPSRQQVLARAGQPASTAPEALLLAALRSLPARQREGLVLRCYAGLPETQIASAMGISTRAVSSHIRRGISIIQAAQQHAATTSLPGSQPGRPGASGRPGTLPRRLPGTASRDQADACPG